jgi:hypothetical protein
MISAGCVSKGEEKAFSLHRLFVFILLHKPCEMSLLYPLVKKLPTGHLLLTENPIVVNPSSQRRVHLMQNLHEPKWKTARRAFF